MCGDCRWRFWLERIREAVSDAGDLPERAEDFASGVTDTLESIEVWVEEHEHITEAQIGAVSNMESAIGRWVR